MAPDRSVAVRLAGFVAVVIVAFGAAFGVGRAVGPLDDGRPPTGADHHGEQHDHEGGQP